jgi:hypothetical protein
MKSLFPYAFLVLMSACCSSGFADEAPIFEKMVLTTNFYAEAANFADINGDGHQDVIYGPHWYAGPDFKSASEIYPVTPFDPLKYSNNFMTEIDDVNGDGHVDVLVNEWPGKAIHWFENPGSKPGHWGKHLAHPVADNESIQMGDITGDGVTELIFHTGGQLGYASRPATAGEAWPFTVISEKEKWHRYTHGLGYGDVNGDNLPDYLMANGWWEQPSAQNESGLLWEKHPVDFGKGGAQMHTYDVDGDGDQDVVTSLVAHGYGMAWFEQIKRDGAISFERHVIMGEPEDENPKGICCSQLHAVMLHDMNGDGLKDIITGKRYWAHGPNKDPEPNAPALLIIFLLQRTSDGVKYVPHVIDDNSGVGTQFAVGDLNADKKPDIVIGNKKGGFVFLQK